MKTKKPTNKQLANRLDLVVQECIYFEELLKGLTDTLFKLYEHLNLMIDENGKVKTKPEPLIKLSK